ncbi:Band 4.1 protein 4B [Fasciola hepatica]|uniref:Band 4.1 protein 4B n=1 Tax=Fasciola hepatica TaxID=6192 RepID=A0A4E0RWF5_FASHE|nr:Band 4.1 protein 4B [Fasciola hepatica]
MAAIIRFFSRRFGRKKDAPAPSHVEEEIRYNKTKKTKKSDLECRVTYLDGTEQTFYLPKKAEARELYDISFAYVGINEEKDYFGLKYDGKYCVWLDPTKSIHSQCKASSPYTVALKVKFFASDPQNLRDEYTRYLVVLQLRDDIRTGKLPCEDFQLAAELAALLLQAEFGDFDPSQHTPVFVSTFRFLPDEKQTEDFEMAVLYQYNALGNRKLTPAAAESIYLEKARLLPDYGVDMHTVKGKNKEDYKLGLTPTGILVYEGNKKIGLFCWPMILKLEMNRTKLKILVADEDEASRKVTEVAFCFVLPDSRSCKALWKSAVEYHTFFRLTDRCPSPPKRRRFFRLGSRFHASFNTEYQLHNLNLFGSSSFRKRRAGSTRSAASAPSSPNVSTPRLTETGVKTASSFRRMPSRRFNSRPSFANRTGLDDRKKARRNWTGVREPAASPVTSGQSPGVFEKARTVVNIERASRRGSPGSAHSGAAEHVGDVSRLTDQPSLRRRSPPVPGGNEKTSAAPQPAVRVTPQLGGTEKIILQSPPVKPPRKGLPPVVRNGAPLRNLEVNECFEYSV